MDKSGRKFAKNGPKRPYTACNVQSNGPNEARNTNTKLSDPKWWITKENKKYSKITQKWPKMTLKWPKITQNGHKCLGKWSK